jgi:hypothetical protein
MNPEERLATVQKGLTEQFGEILNWDEAKLTGRTEDFLVQQLHLTKELGLTPQEAQKLTPMLAAGDSKGYQQELDSMRKKQGQGGPEGIVADLQKDTNSILTEMRNTQYKIAESLATTAEAGRMTTADVKQRLSGLARGAMQELQGKGIGLSEKLREIIDAAPASRPLMIQKLEEQGLGKTAAFAKSFLKERLSAKELEVYEAEGIKIPYASTTPSPAKKMEETIKPAGKAETTPSPAENMKQAFKTTTPTPSAEIMARSQVLKEKEGTTPFGPGFKSTDTVFSLEQAEELAKKDPVKKAQAAQTKANVSEAMKSDRATQAAQATQADQVVSGTTTPGASTQGSSSEIQELISALKAAKQPINIEVKTMLNGKEVAVAVKPYVLDLVHNKTAASQQT